MLRSLALIAVPAILMFATPADAASFNCAKASTATEKAICKNGQLSGLDSAVGAKYGQLRRLLGAGSAQWGSVSSEQRWWLGQRNSCGGAVGCLRVMYIQRVGDLDGYIATASQ